MILTLLYLAVCLIVVLVLWKSRHSHQQFFLKLTGLSLNFSKENEKNEGECLKVAELINVVKEPTAIVKKQKLRRKNVSITTFFEHQDTLKKWSDPTPSTTSKAKNSKDNLSISTHKSAPESQESRANLSVVDVFSVEPKCSLGKRESQSHEVSSEPSIMTNEQVFSNDASPIDPTNCSNYLPSADKAPFVDSEAINELNELTKSSCLLGSANYGDCKQITSTSEVWNDSIAVVTSTDESRTDKIDAKNLIQCQISENVALSPHTISSVVSKLCGSESSSSTISNTSAAVDKISAADIRPVGQNPTTNLPELVAKSDKIKPELLGSVESSKGPIQPQDEAVDSEPLDTHAEQRTSLLSDKSSSTPDKLEGESDSFMNNADTNQMNDLNMTGRTEVSKNEDPAEDGHLNITCLRLNAKLTELEVSATEKAKSTCSLSTMPSSHFILKGYESNNRSLDARFNDKDEKALTGLEEDSGGEKSWNQFSNLLNNIEDIINNIDIRDNSVELEGGGGGGGVNSECPYANNPCGTRATSAQAASVYGKEEENVNNCLESSAQQLQPLGSASVSVSVSKAIDAFNNLHSYESCYSSMNAINKLLQPSYNPILTYQCRNLMKDLNDSDLRDSLKIATNREVTAEIVEQNLARRLDKSNKSSGGDRKPSLNEQNADLGGKLHSNSSLSRSLLFHDLNGAGVASESSSYDIVDDLRSREEDETEERGVEEEEEEEEEEEPTIEDFSEDSALARLDFQLSSSSETLLNDELSHEFESEKIAEFQSCESLVSAKNKLDILNNSLINNNEIIKTVLSATSSLDFINDDFVDIFKEDESISSDENSFIMNELSILNEDAESKNVLSLPSSTDSTSSLAAEDVSLNEVESLSSSILSSESYETLNPINLVNGGGTNCSYSWVYEGSDDTRFEPDFTETEHMLLSLNLSSNCNHFVKSKLNTILECDEHNSVDSVEINGLSNSLTTDLKDEQDSTDDIDYSSELPHPSNLEKYLNQDAVEKCSWSNAGGDVKLTSFSTELSSTSFISNESDVDQHDVDPKWSRAADVKISILNRKNNALSKLKPVNPIVLNESKLSGFAPLKKNNCSTPPTYLPASNKIVTDESDELKFSQTDREEYEIDVINNCISASDPTPGIDLDLRSLEERSNVVDETVIAVMHPLLNANSKNRLSENCNLYENNATQNVGTYDEDDDDDDKEEEEEGEEEGVRENSLPAPGNCELYSLSDIDRAIDQMEEARVGTNNNCGFVYNISPSERYHREFRAIANLDSASFDADEDDDDNDDDCHSSDDDGCDSEDVKISESTTNSAISEFDDSVISEFDNFMLFDSDSKLISDCNTSAISEFTDSAISEYDTSAFENSFSTLPNVNSEIISVCPENLKYFNNKHAHYPSHPSENRKNDLKDREGLKNLPDLCQTCPFTRALSDESLSDSNGGLGSKKSNDLTDRLNYNALNIIEKQMSVDDFNDDFSDSDHGIELADFESRSSNCSPDYSTNHAIVDDSKLHANQKINQNFYENLLINLDKFKNYSIKDKITYYELKTNQNYNTVSNSDKKFNILKTFGDLKSMKSSVDRRRASKILREEKKFDNDSACETLGISQVLCNDSGDNIRCSDAIRCSDNNSDWKFKYLTKSELKSLKLSDGERSFQNTREKSKSFSDIADSNISQSNRENLAFSVHLGFNKGQQYASECQIFFRSGVLAQLEMKRDEKLTDRIIKLQSHCRGFLARKKLAKLKVEDLAVRCIQRNVRKFMSVRDWAWWRLLVRVTPLLNVHRTEEELKSKTEELENLRAKVEKLEQERTLLKHETDKLETKLSEMTVDLAEEHSTATVASERLEIETSERLRLEKELQEIQGQNKRLQENGERLELEVLCLHTAEVNGSALHSEDDDDESGDRTGVYKRRYERVARELEFTKRRLQQQHQDDLEQLIGLRKQLEKKLADAYEEVEEQRQVVAQWKRKVQKLNAELNDVRLLLEEQNSRNILLEKKQRKFDAELQMLQDELRNERQQKERASRERELAVGDKYSMEQTLSAVKLELELKEQKLANLNRELEELTFNGNTEEEVANLKKSKHQLDNKIKDQEEELDDLAGQVQMLEQAKLKLEMSLEQMRKEHRRELMQKDDEIEDARCSAVKKVKALECQLESEHEERTLLLRERHELERRLNDVEDRERVNRTNDQEQLSRLRRDLKRTKALLRDAQIMLQQAKADTPNKTILRQLRNQLDDAECARNLAMKARQTAEADLMETQLALEEATRTKSEAEDKAAMISRERSQIQSQLDENEEELAEVLKKYRATVQQLSSEQSQLREQAGKIAELETERQSLKDQLSEMTSRLENVETMNDPASSLTVKRLELKCKELESKLELEQTTRSRMEVQINRLKETAERLQSDADIARGRETAAQDLVRKLQRNIRDLKEQLSQHESRENNEATRRKELEKRLEESETETSAAKSDLRLALKRIEDLQLAIQGELDHDDEDDDSPTDSDNDSASSDESFESFMTNHHSTSAERSSVSRSNFSRTEEISPLKISNSSTEAKSSSPPSSFA